MCGIVGYTGFRRAKKVLLDGLQALEYRGYDSAGVALADGKLKIYKCGGRVATLSSIIPRSKAHTGIGHTRWATHGAPCAENAHPHLSFDGKIAIVHNGVIENHDELRAELTDRGIPLASQTDSELIAHMLALEEGDMRERLFKVAARTEGAMTVLAVCENDSRIYAYRRGAALVVAEGNGESFASSDMLALAPYVGRVTVLKDGECAVLSPDGISVFTADGGRDDHPESLPLSVRIVKKSECHMRDEIEEIPDALLATLRSFECGFRDREKVLSCLVNSKNILLTGCGTAYHACLYGCEVLERLAGIPCRALPAGEVEDPTFTDGNTFCIFVTQSGETADTLRAMEVCRKKGAYTFAVTNVEGSTAALQADGCFLLRAGAEVAVAATKSYCCQLLALWLLAKAAEGSGGERESAEDLAAKCRDALSLPVFTECCRASKLFFIGKGTDSITAREGALKFKEITWRSADAYTAGELKHGAIALADTSSAAVAVLTDAADAPRMRAAVSELRSRGTRVYALSAAGDIGANVTVALPRTEECLLMPALAVIPLQKLALESALLLGRDPDKPRNLAKSVTVI